MSDRNDSNSECKIVSVKAHTKMLAQHFLSGSFQSQSADHKRTSTTSFCPMRTALNDASRDCTKQHTSNEEQTNRQEYKNGTKGIQRHTVLAQLNEDRRIIDTPLKVKANTATIGMTEMDTAHC